MMLRRTLLAAIGLAAVICLGGCVVHGHGHNGVRARTTHNPRVFNIKARSYPHSHHGSGTHSHAGGNQSHGHDKPAKKDHDYPAHQRGYHDDGDLEDSKGHDNRRKGHDNRRKDRDNRRKGHDKNRD